jgi:hypothetical protein
VVFPEFVWARRRGAERRAPRQLYARFPILTVVMISPALDHAISAKLQRISAAASLFDVGLERADQARRKTDGDHTASEALTDLAELLEAQIIEGCFASS